MLEFNIPQAHEMVLSLEKRTLHRVAVRSVRSRKKIKGRIHDRPTCSVGSGRCCLWNLQAASRQKKVFVSYYYDADRHYKKLLSAWSANDKFELEFEDVSTDVSIKSDNEAYIKRVIGEQIRQCDVFLVLVGKDSYKRDWIAWEVAKAKEYGKKIVAVKEKRTHASPDELLSAGAVWVYGFEEKKIRDAIEN